MVNISVQMLNLFIVSSNDTVGEMQHTDDDGGGGGDERSQKWNIGRVQTANHWKHATNNGNIPAQPQGNDQINTHTHVELMKKNPNIQYLPTDNKNGWGEREKKSCKQKLSKLCKLKI